MVLFIWMVGNKPRYLKYRNLDKDMNIKGTHEYLITKLVEFGFMDIATSSCKSNGESYYVYAKAFANNDTVKFRTSDHSVFNSGRIMNEIHLNDIASVDRWFLSLEKKRNPERFSRLLKPLVSNLENVPTCQLQDGDVVTGTRTTKKGTTHYSITRTLILDIVTDERI